MSIPADARRRWFGMFFLLLAFGMLVWGQTVLKPRLGQGIAFVLYWLACFAFTGLAILTALLDFWIVRRRSRVAQRELLRKTIDDLPLDERDSPTGKRPKQEN